MSLYLKVRESGGNSGPGVNWSVFVPPVGISCPFLKLMIVTHSCSSRKIRNLDFHVKSLDFLFHYFSYILCNIFTFYFEITTGIRKNSPKIFTCSLQVHWRQESPHVNVYSCLLYHSLYLSLSLSLFFLNFLRIRAELLVDMTEDPFRNGCSVLDCLHDGKSWSLWVNVISGNNSLLTSQDLVDFSFTALYNHPFSFWMTYWGDSTVFISSFWLLRVHSV